MSAEKLLCVVINYDVLIIPSVRPFVREQSLSGDGVDCWESHNNETVSLTFTKKKKKFNLYRNTKHKKRAKSKTGNSKILVHCPEKVTL